MTQVDWRIPLQGRAPEIRSPLDAYSGALQLKGQVQSGQIRDLQSQKLQKENAKLDREARGLQAYNDLMQKNLKFNDDGTVKIKSAAIRSGLIKAGFGDLAKQYEQGRLDAKKRSADASLAELNEFRQGNVVMGGMAGQVLADPKAYPEVLNQAKEMGLDVAEWPAEYSDELRPKLLGALYGSLSGREILDLEIKRKDPERVQEWYEFAAQTLGPYKDQMGWTQGRDFLKAKEVPEGVMQLIPEQYSPEAAQAVAQLGLTPNQQQKSPPTEGAIKRERAFAAYAQSRNLDPAKLNPDQQMEALREHTEAVTPKTDTRRDDERRSAGAEYTYRQRVNDLEGKRKEEKRQVNEDAYLTGSVDRRVLQAIDDKYDALLDAAKRVYESEGASPPAPQEEKVPTWDPATGRFE